MASFSAAGVVTALVLALAGALVSQRAARSTAVADAREVTRVLAASVVEPHLSNGVAAGDPAAVAVFAAAVRPGLARTGLVRFKLWTAGGRIVWSDERRIIGMTFPLGADDLAVLRTGRSEASVSDLSQAENEFERGRGKLLEAYQRVLAPDGSRLLFETYSRNVTVSARSRDIWWAFAPIILGALLLLQLVQVPLAASMARRLERAQRSRERLLQQAIASSAAERRRIAGELHDGVVQDLAGASYAVSGAADRAARGETAALAATLRDVAGGIRQAIRVLRTLLVDIYPPNLRSAGLPQVLSDLLAPLASRGVRTEIDVPADLVLPPEAEALVYRTAQEAIRNTVKHAEAGALTVRIERLRGRVVLTVHDDGVGFDVAARPAGRDEGHLGLMLVADLAASAGSLLEVDATPGEGTRVRLEVPLP